MLNIYAENIVINYVLSILLFCIVVLYLQHVCVSTCDISESSLANKGKHGLIMNREEQKIK